MIEINNTEITVFYDTIHRLYLSADKDVDLKTLEAFKALQITFFNFLSFILFDEIGKLEQAQEVLKILIDKENKDNNNNNNRYFEEITDTYKILKEKVKIKIAYMDDLIIQKLQEANKSIEAYVLITYFTEHHLNTTHDFESTKTMTELLNSGYNIVKKTFNEIFGG